MMLHGKVLRPGTVIISMLLLEKKRKKKKAEMMSIVRKLGS